MKAVVVREARVQGWSSGTATDSEDTMAFAAAHGVNSMNEVFAFDSANDAYGKMADGSVRFRAVLEMAAE